METALFITTLQHEHRHSSWLLVR